jgi:hypothetical protein
MNHIRKFNENNQVEEHIDVIKDMFSDITDDFNISYDPIYHAMQLGGPNGSQRSIFIDITINNKAMNSKFVSEILSFAKRVSSYCNLNYGFCVAGDDFISTKDTNSLLKSLQSKRNCGEYLQVYFTEK